ncbi:Radical SAM superfamily protein [Dehalogenimonas formicexedens]|uniref:Radical SAM superfamily protein n=1 Tax=Dehalogenimonas formicexedens TaxID=1839801 RepID=A0A1P8F5I4_9CHLR|nr:radical SAM protein [Dehalogenimonas formicexedens]APV43739.1 Radical SAM superfamily protein [Dehalogenimonas formicexedens]
MSKLKIIGESKTSFGHYINTYNGCAHSCVYCYAKGIAHRDSVQWRQATPRVSFIENLKKDIELLKQNPSLREGINDIWVSSFTDCYQPLEKENHATRQTLELLIANELPFTVLTKNALVLEDLNLLKGYPKCRVGLTLTTLDETYRQYLEPYTSTTDEKIVALETLKANGVSTYCSVEPITSKLSDPVAIVKRLAEVMDLFEFGVWNEKYHIPGLNYDEPYLMGELDKVMTYCRNSKIKHCTAGHSEDKLLDYDLPFIPSSMFIP